MEQIGASSMDHIFLKKITNTIHENLENDQFGVEELSEQIGISRSQLYRKIKLLRGKSISQFIREVRLEEAMKLLRDDVATTSEIAYRVGFGSPTYFHRCFRAYYGYSPGEVKKQTAERKLDSKNEATTFEDEKTIPDTRSIPPELYSKPYKKSPEEQKSHRRYRVSSLNVIVPIVIILVALVLAGHYLYPGKQKKRSVAILPLHNFTGDPEQDYFVNGLHDALIGTLGQISGLRVISRTSTLRYRQTDKSLQVIAKELGVDAILEGSIMGSGDDARIELQLIEAFPEEQHLWAKEYHLDMRKILALQSDVARNIAGALSTTLTSREESLLTNIHAVDPDAYKACLKGMFYCDKFTEEGFNTAMQYFELARELDPNYALADVGIARVWVDRMQNGLVSYVEAGPKIKAATNKAFKMDSTLSEAYYLLGMFSCWGEWNYKKGEKELRHAVALNPNYSHARAILSHTLNILHQPEEAMEQIETALNLDPANPLFKSLYAMDLNFTRQYDKAISLLSNTLKTAPEYNMALSTLRTSYHMKGMYPKALKIWKESYEAKGDHKAVEALELGAQQGGYQGALENLARLLIARSDTTYVTPWQIGTLFTRAGKKDEAIAWLEKAYYTHDSNMPYIGVDPIFDVLKDDPRFQRLLKRMGLPSDEYPMAKR